MANSDKTQARCLILACGNTLREDDGVGPFLARWAENRWRGDARVRVLSEHQWTPEVIEDIAQAESVVFVDCATDCAAGTVKIMRVQAAPDSSQLGTHHLDASQLLVLSKEVYGRMPGTSLLLTVGAASLDLREGFSEAVEAALPEAQRVLEGCVQRLLNPDQRA